MMSSILLRSCPNSVADLGLKKGEKIDYAIMRDGKVNILIEAKKVGEELSLDHANQLVRYFHTSDARIGVLTNGRTWQFYTDLEKPNRLDERPFLVLDLLDVDPVALPHLEKMAKESFDLDSVIASAEELKFVSAIKKEIAQELNSPGDEFVRLFARRVYDRNLSAKVMETFAVLTEKAARQHLNDRVNARLKSAMEDHAPTIGPVPDEVQEDQEGASRVESDQALGSTKPGVKTTEEEIQAFRIVKAILAGLVPMGRIFIRDQTSYCSVILDNTNRKPIVRFFFDGHVKRIVVFDAEKHPTRVDIETLEDIYAQSDALRTVVAHYINSGHVVAEQSGPHESLDRPSGS